MDVSISIIGAGVIGLAVAQRLSKSHNNLFILEKNAGFGQETSSRNSEVIHSGIYYPESSLKAKLCVEGNQLLYKYCQERDIPHKKCGKLIVATSEKDVEKLLALNKQAEINKVKGVELIDQRQILKLEPNISAKFALHVSSTGIIDSHILMEKLLADSLENGAEIAYQSELVGIAKIKGGYKLKIKESEGTLFEFTSENVINCAGLNASFISKISGMDLPEYKTYFCKGEYFRIAPPKNKLVSRLIYPLPFKNLKGLGIHATIDLGGGLKLGPNTTYLNNNVVDYRVDPNNKELFYKAAKKYLPFLEADDLSPDMAGIRPKLQAPGEQIKDFLIHHETSKGYPGFINLIGIESPGLTSSMAIAKYVSKLIQNK